MFQTINITSLIVWASSLEHRGCLRQTRHDVPRTKLYCTDCLSFSLTWKVKSCNSHVLSVALGDLVSDGILVRQVFIMEEVLPALRLIEISYLR